jgi:hypothetical protein
VREDLPITRVQLGQMRYVFNQSCARIDVGYAHSSENLDLEDAVP